MREHDYDVYVSDGLTFSVRYFTAPDEEFTAECVYGGFYFRTVFSHEIFCIGQGHVTTSISFAFFVKRLSSINE